MVVNAGRIGCHDYQTLLLSEMKTRILTHALNSSAFMGGSVNAPAAAENATLPARLHANPTKLLPAIQNFALALYANDLRQDVV